MTRVSTRPSVIAPTSLRSCTSFLLTEDDVVFGRSMIIGAPAKYRGRVPRSAWAERAWGPRDGSARSGERRGENVAGLSRDPPGATLAGHHLVRRRRTPAAGRGRLGAPVRGPPGLDRVEDLPGQLDLLMAGEERRVAEQDVEDEPLVGLRTGLGEGVAVAEVHRDVPDLHLRARHLRPEPHGDAL